MKVSVAVHATCDYAVPTFKPWNATRRVRLRVLIEGDCQFSCILGAAAPRPEAQLDTDAKAFINVLLGLSQADLPVQMAANFLERRFASPELAVPESPITLNVR